MCYNRLSYKIHLRIIGKNKKFVIFIYCDDAPALEAKLHQTFSDKRVNAINYRKEYFNVTLEEIKKAIKDMGFEIQYFDQPTATQYYNSMKLRYRE